MTGNDMIVRLYTLPEEEKLEGIKLKRAFCGDKDTILRFVEESGWPGWKGECEYAILHSTCFIAVKDGKVVGFACYDATGKDYFGPIGVSEECRHDGIGKALLLRTLYAMREEGYAYAVIGWVRDAEHFYRKTVGAEFIPGGTPDKSIYVNMIRM